MAAVLSRFCSKYHLPDKDQKSLPNFIRKLQEKHQSEEQHKQAFNALLFLYRNVLKRELGDLEDSVRAKRKPYIPVVLSREEIDAIFYGKCGTKKA